MIYTSVQGGTNAGRKAPKKNQFKEPWVCACGSKNAYYWNPCPACGAQRPERS